MPVTVIEAGPCKVTAVRRDDRDGYSAVQLAFGQVKQSKLSKAERPPEEGRAQRRCGTWSSSVTRS